MIASFKIMGGLVSLFLVFIQHFCSKYNIHSATIVHVFGAMCKVPLKPFNFTYWLSGFIIPDSWTLGHYFCYVCIPYMVYFPVIQSPLIAFNNIRTFATAKKLEKMCKVSPQWRDFEDKFRPIFKTTQKKIW